MSVILVRKKKQTPKNRLRKNAYDKNLQIDDLVRDLEAKLPSGDGAAEALINYWVLVWLCARQGLISKVESAIGLAEAMLLPDCLQRALTAGGVLKLRLAASMLRAEWRENLWQRLDERLEAAADACPEGNLPGDIYESLMSRGIRKQQGQYYTPTPIIDRILANTLAKADVLEQPFLQVLDPACGSGHFLLAAYRLLRQKFVAVLPKLQQRYRQEMYSHPNGLKHESLSGENYWQEKYLHHHILTYCLFGAETDAGAAGIATMALLLQNPGTLMGKVNIFIGDSLLKWEQEAHWQIEEGRIKHLPTEEVFSSQQYKEGRRFWQRRFDYVLGNPPYISFGLNRTGRLGRNREQYYRTEYPGSAEYKINYYALFFERGVEVLRPGGQLGYITPDSFLLGRYFSRLRRHLLEQCTIHSLTLLDGRAFRRATVGVPTITVLQKGISSDGADETAVQVSRWNGLESEASHSYPQEYFSRQPYFRFRLFFDQRDQEIVEKMEMKAETLLLRGCIRTGMRGRHGQASLKSRKNNGGTWRPGLVSSGQVTAFAIQQRGDWLNVDPELLYGGGWDEKIISGPKILLRQTGDSLVAAIDRQGLYHLNNLHSISLSDREDSVPLEFLAGLLNSRLLNYYYHVVSLEKGRPMAQTDIETLEKLPVVSAPGPLVEEISAIVRKLERNGVDGEAAAGCRRRIDQAVYRLYGLEAAEIFRVESQEPEVGYEPGNRVAKG